MNTVAEIAPVITADRAALRRDFPLKPFAIRHRLAGHPLLTLPRIAQLASELPRDLIEYNSGKVAISQDPDAIPSVDLDPVEVVRRIETSGAWMVLKRVENSPEYRRLRTRPAIRLWCVSSGHPQAIERFRVHESCGP